MNSRHLSILPDDAAGDSTADAGADSGANFGTNLGGSLASYRARYQAFLNQQSQRSQRRVGPSAVVRLVQGVINFAIFVALFLAILTLFGFGLSRLGPSIHVVSADVSASGKQPAAMADVSPSPARKKRIGKR
jgi:hypothetical protein